MSAVDVNVCSRWCEPRVRRTRIVRKFWDDVSVEEGDREVGLGGSTVGDLERRDTRVRATYRGGLL